MGASTGNKSDGVRDGSYMVFDHGTVALLIRQSISP